MDSGLTSVSARPSLRVYLESAWHHRFFLMELTRTRVAAANSGYRLGGAWLLLTPILSCILYFVVFGVLLGVRHSVEHYPLFILTGVLLYTFFSWSASASLKVLHARRDLVRTLPFPNILVVLSSTGEELIRFTWSLLVLYAVALISVGFSPGFLSATAGILLLIMFTFGFSLLMARLSSSIPDIKGLMPFILRAGAYLSGVYFPLTIMSGDPTPLTRVLSLNPLVAYLTIVRDGLMGESIPASLWLLGGTAAVLMLLVGGYAFYRGEPKYGY